MPQRLCRRVDCPNPVVGRKFYCSKQCSAKTRNRRYYNTTRGRWSKRRAASRYFQNHRATVYARKAKRLAGYMEKYKPEAQHEANMSCVGYNEHGRLYQAGQPDGDRVLRLARRIVTVRHDWHPQTLGDTPLGRPIWQMLDPALFVRKTKRAVPGRKTNREEYLSVKAFIRRFQKVQSLRHY